MTAMLQQRYASKVHAHARPREYFHRSLETLSRSALEKMQLRRLRATVKRAFEAVPLHRKRLDAAGITPRDVRSLEDLRELPFTLKSDLREHYPFRLFARPRATLGPEFPIAIPRPRDRRALNHDPEFRHVRTAVIEYLLSTKHAPRPAAPEPAPALSGAPAEVST